MCACLLLAACVTKVPADPARLSSHGEALPPIEWPELVGKDPMLPPPDERGLTPVVLLAHGLNGNNLARVAFHTKAEVLASREAPYGKLVALRVVRSPDWEAEPDKRTMPVLQRLQYLAKGPTLREGMKEVQEGRKDAITLTKEQEAWGDVPADSVLFDIREASPFAPHGVRGIILWFHSLGGLTFEEAAIAEMQRRGWHVVVSTFPWGMQADLNLMLIEGAVDSMARIAARSVDRRMAMGAYGAEAAVDYMQSCTPGLAEKPIVVWGASAGSFVAPAVAARLGERVKAMILVGSGANLMEVSQKSTFFDGGVRLQYLPTEKMRTKEEEETRRTALKAEFIAEYAKATRLDSLAVGPRLRTVPTLMLHGVADEIVPANEGDELWQLLGKPERWEYSLGHQALFWRLSSQRIALADWLDATLPAAPAQ
jgi:fermentation-respiration switch protein FrsA (DUF1100 family)